MALADAVLTALGCALLVPVAFLALETVAALLPARQRPRDGSCRPVRAAVLIPAHNEEAGIARTVTGVLGQLESGDCVLVVADNCSDGTALAARTAGAEVIERTDAERRGKGYALDFGLRHLDADPPNVVVVLDADCRAAAGALALLKREAVAYDGPVQAVYLLAPPADGERSRGALSRFAFQFKNEVRPRGLHRLGLPCLLTGTGMAFPWHVIRKANVGTGNIVEDMKLGLDLALQGHYPRLCPQARVEGDAAPSDRATASQRTRWEHGHVRTLLTQAPRLLWASLVRGRLRLFALALELGVPPLSLLMLGLTGLTAAALLWWQVAGGSALPFALLAGGCALAALTVSAAWAGFGRRAVPARALLTAPLYVLWKVPIYLRLVRNPQHAWVRTERQPAP